MDPARANKLIDLHCAMRKIAFAHVLPAASADFEQARARLGGAKHASELRDIDTTLLRHLTTR